MSLSQRMLNSQAGMMKSTPMMILIITWKPHLPPLAAEAEIKRKEEEEARKKAAKEKEKERGRRKRKSSKAGGAEDN